MIIRRVLPALAFAQTFIQMYDPQFGTYKWMRTTLVAGSSANRGASDQRSSVRMGFTSPCHAFGGTGFVTSEERV
jgi:hypothetical protein